MPAYEASVFDPPAPVATVIIEVPGEGKAAATIQVPMLIDSGADATLIPQAVAERIGVKGTGERFQLEAFDGTLSESEAVRVHLIFLKKRFRGRFLLIDSSIGVIGRDILNRIRLLLDGPNASWGEHISRPTSE